MLSPAVTTANILKIRKGPLVDSETTEACPASVITPIALLSCTPIRSEGSIKSKMFSKDRERYPAPDLSWRRSLQLAELYLQRQKYEAGTAVLEPLLLQQPSEPDVHCLNGKLLASLDNKAGVHMRWPCMICQRPSMHAALSSLSSSFTLHYIQFICPVAPAKGFTCCYRHLRALLSLSSCSLSMWPACMPARDSIRAVHCFQKRCRRCVRHRDLYLQMSRSRILWQMR